MKSILEWLNEAKQQGYEWADAAIRNYNSNYAIIKEVETLSSALIKAFSWRKSPEGFPYWNRVFEIITTPLPITPVIPTNLEDLIEDLEKLNNAIENLEYNDTLKEPYRTQVFEATKASYEEQLAETKTKIAKSLGIEPVKERKLIGWVVQNEDGSYRKRKVANFRKETGGWCTLGGITWENITPDQAKALCGRLPKWSDDEPTPIYE